MRKNNARIDEKKKGFKAKNCTQAFREVKFLIPRKITLVFSEHSNTTEGILNFRAKGIKYFESLKMK